MEVDIVCKLGVVDDYYNLIHRHNINHYYLCKINSFGATHMTDQEINDYHMSILKVDFQEALREYERWCDTKLGRLVARRELPILKHAVGPKQTGCML